MKVPAAFLLISVCKSKIRTHFIYSYRRIFEPPAPLFCSLHDIMLMGTFFCSPCNTFCSSCTRICSFLLPFGSLKQDPISMPTWFPYCSTTLTAWIKLKEQHKPKQMLSSLFFSISTYRFSLPTILYLFLVFLVTTSVTVKCVILIGFNKSAFGFSSRRSFII